MRRRVIGLACLLVSAAVPVASAQPLPSYLSVERVRAALMKPLPRLSVENRQADFSVYVQEPRPLDDLFEVPLWETPVLVAQPQSTLARIEGVPRPAPALVQYRLDPTSFAKSAARSVRERSVRRQVEKAIAQYCAAQPDAGTSTSLCWSASAAP